MTGKLEQALRLAEEGFYVFPLKKNGKTPAHEGWQQEATRDEDEIYELFNNKKDHNIGIFTGRYGMGQALVVVDVDTKEGKRGDATMQELDILGYDFPPTHTATTASGGRHLIYHYDYPLSGGANKIGEHVDLKSHGGYIVGEGSTIDGKPYYRSHDTQPVRAPDWIRDKCGRPMERSPNDAAIEHFDTDQAIARAKDYIKNSAPNAAKGQRNDLAYRVAARLRDFGLTEPQAQALMIDWDANKCEPQLDPEELTQVTASAYKSANLAAGNDSPHAFFESIPYDPKTDNTRESGKEGLYYVLPKRAQIATDQHALIKNFLDLEGISILYGDSNTGKTFIALDLAYHVATGSPWNGNKTTKGAVLYLAAEGGRSALNRLIALKQHYGNDDFPLALTPCQVNLFDSIPDFKAFVQLIRQGEADPEVGPIRFLVIDTLSRVLAGGNENDSQDMGEFVKNVTSLKEHFRCHILIVHHSGKDAAKGARGHSLLRAAVDTELEIADGLITTKKQRDMEFAKPQGFELEKVLLGNDSDHQPITSCVINYVDAEARNAFNQQNRLEPRDLVALLALQNYAPRTRREAKGHDNVIDQKTWGQCCKDFDFTLVPGAVRFPESEDSFRKAFTRCRDRLVAFGRVVEIDKKQWAFVKIGQPDTTGRTP